ncbi:TPA: hypothetical protein ACSY8X_14570 [Listeria monocytogenes]|uniref:hypothetical protein n=1 Tax=Listeria monocytogenes TaxID=1639 RepID=UPI00077B1FBC|nr:hypothetical protein [Listeria monocytogenes]EAC3669427.1 hypothetical protein [Listeria monocytogenes]EAC8654947.1 hypothetical protein [Listeria monocytogenes]EAC9604685.1 hypothetical protein [Listeria monocytogenes]EAD2410496.1 hypothetical protein [Listeria monocytogenes]EAD8889226.1 hypothetical protein [Listeria monocytogenes]
MTNKRYALYVEEGKYLESWGEETQKAKFTNDFNEATTFTSFEEADKEANKLNSDVVMVVEVTHLKPTIICC